MVGTQVEEEDNKVVNAETKTTGGNHINNDNTKTSSKMTRARVNPTIAMAIIQTSTPPAGTKNTSAKKVTTITEAKKIINNKMKQQDTTTMVKKKKKTTNRVSTLLHGMIIVMRTMHIWMSHHQYS